MKIASLINLEFKKFNTKSCRFISKGQKKGHICSRQLAPRLNLVLYRTGLFQDGLFSGL